MKHEGIIEHRGFTASFITDRGVSHEFVRHRIASYLQESSRYCNYSKSGLQFILPPWINKDVNYCWDDYILDCQDTENTYNKYIKDFNWKPEQARYFLSNGLKTEFCCSMNLRSWYNFLKMRTPANAHPQIRQLSISMLKYLREKIPVLFDDFVVPSYDFELAELIEHPGTDPIEFNIVYES